MQNKWEETEDKPAAIAVTAGAFLVLIAASSVVDAIVSNKPSSRAHAAVVPCGYKCVPRSGNTLDIDISHHHESGHSHQYNLLIKSRFSMLDATYRTRSPSSATSLSWLALV